MATKGDVRREDFLWKEGMPNWVLAAKVNGLFPILSNSPPNEPAQSSIDSRTTNSTLKSQVASTVPTKTPAGVTPNTPEMASDAAWVVVQTEVPLPKGTQSASSRPVLNAAAVFTMKGVQDVLEVFDDRVTITPKGVLGFLNKGLKGTKEIPFTSIIAVQFREGGTVFSGYLQFTIPGGNESKGGLWAAAQDENTFMFTQPFNAMAKEIKEHIDAKVRSSRTPQLATHPASLSDELQKLAKLKEQGVLSADEFQAAKKKLIE